MRETAQKAEKPAPPSVLQGLVVFGLGGHARECAWIAETAGWTVGCFIDRAPGAPREHGAPVFEETAFLEGAAAGFDGVIGIGHGAVRRRIAERVGAKWGDQARWAILRHASAVVAPGAALGVGSVVFPQACVSVDARIGAHAIVNLGATISHDVVIGDYVSIGPGARIAGGVEIGDEAMIGVGAAIRNATSDKQIRVGAGAVIGAGAAVVDDIPAGATAVGVPARVLGA